MINISNICFLFLFIGILFVPFNLQILGPFRATDIFISLSIIMFFLKLQMDKLYFNFLLLIFILIFLSSVFGLAIVGFVQLETIGFLYKFYFPFLLFALVVTLLKYKDYSKIIHFALFSTFLFLVIWVYLYSYLRDLGIVVGNYRPSFPFSEDFNISDAHLYSSYLALGLIMYLFYWSKFFNIAGFFNYLLFILSLGSIFLTGSRGGIVLVFAAFLIWIVLIGYKIVLAKLYYLPVAGFLVLIIINMDILPMPGEDSFKLISRAMDFELADDESSLGRIRKLKTSFDQTERVGYLLGVGLFSNKLIWYDGLIGIINSYLGLLGIFLFLGFVLYVIFSIYKLAIYEKYGSYIFIIVFITYFIANIITEYFLVTRSVVPVVVFLATIYFDILKKKILYHE